jgi:ABC-type multidrug transport system ATPase subunit
VTAAVRARGVVKRFGSTTVLDGVDLDVSEGQGVGLSGANGAGRTVLLQMLAALRRPTLGEIEIAGIDAVRRPVDARALVVYVDGEPYGAGGLTVRQYVDFVLAVRQRTSRRGGASGPLRASGPQLPADDAIARAGLLSGVVADRLSPGQRKQLALAAALASGPHVLLLDDPLSSLDAAARDRFVAWIREVRAGGAAILAAVNTVEDAGALCDSVVRLERGRLFSSAAARDPRGRVSAVPAGGRA